MSDSKGSKGYIVHDTLKDGVGLCNPYVYDMPAVGLHLMTFKALVKAFMDSGTVFAGSINQFVDLGIEFGLNESDLRKGFTELAGYGYISIDGDVFTPLEKFVSRFSA